MQSLNEIDMDTVAKIAAGLVSGGGIAALINAVASRRKSAAEGSKTEAEAALLDAKRRKLEGDMDPEAAAVKILMDLLDSLNEQIKKSDEREVAIQERVKAMDDEIRRLRKSNIALEEQVITLKAIVEKHESRMARGDDPFTPMMRGVNQEHRK